MVFFFALAAFTGEVELENLPLRRDALRNLGLPLQALSGTVGKIKLQIPVRSFRTAPWCIYIENVYVVIGPVNLDEVSARAYYLVTILVIVPFINFSGMPMPKSRLI